MLDGSDRGTFFALRLLRDQVGQATKPLIIWAGAGVSRWCGYPGWKESAEGFHAEYLKFEPTHDSAAALKTLREGDYPELFQICRNTSATRYHQKLARLFAPRQITPVYSHFLDAVAKIVPISVVTTNVDETLEPMLPMVATVQRSDLERCLDLLNARQGFVTKLHGSVSAINSVVFTSSDYKALLGDDKYLTILRHLFLRATVVFVGYGLAEKYILDLFLGNSRTRELFGDGPHFAVMSSVVPGVPGSIKAIHYLPEPHTDHRSSITVLDIIRSVKEAAGTWLPSSERGALGEAHGRTSAYFISDITPAGTWISSNSLLLKNEDGTTFNCVVGQGFVDSELPQKTSPALHDLTVGLVELCEFGIRARFINPSAFGFGGGVVAGGASLPSGDAGSTHCAAVAC